MLSVPCPTKRSRAATKVCASNSLCPSLPAMLQLRPAAVRAHPSRVSRGLRKATSIQPHPRPRTVSYGAWRGCDAPWSTHSSRRFRTPGALRSRQTSWSESPPDRLSFVDIRWDIRYSLCRLTSVAPAAEVYITHPEARGMELVNAKITRVQTYARCARRWKGAPYIPGRI